MAKIIQKVKQKLNDAKENAKAIYTIVKSNRESAKINKVVDAHLKRTAGDKRLIADARKRAADPKEGAWGRLGASQTVKSIESGKHLSARNIKKSTEQMKKDLAKKR